MLEPCCVEKVCLGSAGMLNDPGCHGYHSDRISEGLIHQQTGGPAIAAGEASM